VKAEKWVSGDVRFSTCNAYTLDLLKVIQRLNYTFRKMSSNDYVRLESNDGYTFVVARNVACASGMWNRSLDVESESCHTLPLMNRWIWRINFRRVQG
jgi:hypothetical protein